MPDCPNSIHGKGLCSKHYQRLLRSGDPSREPGWLPPQPAQTGKPVCTVDGCGREAKSRGWCATHYMRWYKNGDVNVRQRTGRKPIATRCSVEGCEDVFYDGRVVLGLCPSHYWRLKKYGDPLAVDPRKIPRPCSVEGCERRDHCKGLCLMHYSRLMEHGDPGEPAPRRRAAGEGGIDALGYHRITVNGRHKKAHRHVMEQMLGRELRTFEQVHHINGVKSDNRPENLELWASHPKGQRVADLVEFVAVYYPEEVMRSVLLRMNA